MLFECQVWIKNKRQCTIFLKIYRECVIKWDFSKRKISFFSLFFFRKLYKFSFSLKLIIFMHSTKGDVTVCSSRAHFTLLQSIENAVKLGTHELRPTWFEYWVFRRLNSSFFKAHRTRYNLWCDWKEEMMWCKTA